MTSANSDDWDPMDDEPDVPEIDDVDAMSCRVAFNWDSGEVDPSVFEPWTGKSAVEQRLFRYALQGASAAGDVLVFDMASEQLRDLTRAPRGRGQRPNDALHLALRKELVLSIYALFGRDDAGLPRKEVELAAEAARHGIAGETWKSWRRSTGKTLMDEARRTGQVAVFGPGGFRLSAPLPVRLWSVRADLLERKGRVAPVPKSP